MTPACAASGAEASAISAVLHRLYSNAAPVPMATRLSMFGAPRSRRVIPVR